MRNNYKGRRSRNIIPQDGLQEKQFKAGLPSKESVQPSSEIFNKLAFKDLSFNNVIEVKADPSSAILRGSYPYNIINKTNPVIDPGYVGLPNIEGNVIVRMQNAGTGQLMNLFDVVTINLRANYLYMDYQVDSKHPNLAVNAEMLKTMAESLSKGYSTMLTQLPFYVDKLEAPDVPVPSLTDSDQVYGKLMALVHYQTVLQNGFSILAKYRQTMSVMQMALDMSYRQEANIVSELFGLLSKKSFIATLNSIGSSLIGEYFDSAWYKQISAIVAVPSRKSNSMTDPLLTATMTTLIPRVTFTALNTEDPYYDSDQALSYTGKFVDPDKFTVVDGTKKFEEIVYILQRMLDISTILTWARLLNKTSNVAALPTAQAYFNQIANLVQYVNVMLMRFTSNMTDIRTFLDKMQMSGLTYWKKGMFVRVDDYPKWEPSYNMLLQDIVSVYLGTASTMTYDTNTFRWQASTMWNKYTGIPRFDKVTGGSFITFGLRNLELGGLDKEDIAMCIPVLFASSLVENGNKCLATTRNGLRVTIQTDENDNNIINNAVLARLDPMRVGYKIRVPYMDLSDMGLTTQELASISSTGLALMSQLCGYGYTKTTPDTTSTVADPDYLAFVDIQLEDVSNAMITFCRNYSPFRVTTPDGSKTIGFGSSTIAVGKLRRD